AVGAALRRGQPLRVVADLDLQENPSMKKEGRGRFQNSIAPAYAGYQWLLPECTAASYLFPLSSSRLPFSLAPARRQAMTQLSVRSIQSSNRFRRFRVSPKNTRFLMAGCPSASCG